MGVEIAQVRQGSYGNWGEGQDRAARSNRRGELVTINTIQQFVADGRVFAANSGAGTTPVTFAGAYDADAPDYYIYVPNGTTIIPVRIEVMFEAVGTESTMEILALASDTGDSSATGTALTARNLRIDNPRGSGCTITGSIDAAGITDPNANHYIEFWRTMRQLTDTVATGENDRLPLVFTWSALSDGPAPVIAGHATRGSALAVYAASQAGTGFINVTWIEGPTESFV